MNLTLLKDETLESVNADNVEILISNDGKTVWINIHGVCQFRACNIKNLILDDQRTSKSDSYLL